MGDRPPQEHRTKKVYQEDWEHIGNEHGVRDITDPPKIRPIQFHRTSPHPSEGDMFNTPGQGPHYRTRFEKVVTQVMIAIIAASISAISIALAVWIARGLFTGDWS